MDSQTSPPTEQPGSWADRADDEQTHGEPGERFSVEESRRMASEARRGRELDQALARDLDRAQASVGAVSSSYIRGLGERPRLPASVEQRLVREALAGDRNARAQVVEAFLPLIGSVARNYRSSRQITRTELVQEGVVGLLRALERYDPSLGVPFWGYASWWVRQAMQQLAAELTRPMVMSDRALRQLSQLKDAYTNLQATREHVTLGELGERTGIDRSQLANLIAADRPPKALEEPIQGEEGQIGVFGELIADPLAEDEYERVITMIAIGQLRDLLSGLSDREREVLRARYGLGGPQESLRQIARRQGVSAERVRQVENRALGKLRAAAAESPRTGRQRSRARGSLT
jgi:RNA polymerase primary sigma factor